MSVKQEIDNAIVAHSAWKQTLRKAIDTGKSDASPAVVKMDNQCVFGKWLHERIDPISKNSTYFKDVVKLHAEFHKEAGSILDVALKGETEAASTRIKLGSTFSKVSVDLTKKLKAWQATL